MKKTVLLLGDSLIEYGDWHDLLPGFTTLNRGVAGETVGELAGRIGREVDLDEDPEEIVILSGTNNMLMGDEGFPVVFETMLAVLGQLCPQSRTTVLGLPPVTLPWVEQTRLDQVNRVLAETVQAAGCVFLDLKPDFALHCRPVGNPCFLMDGVHFSPHGYRVLAAVVRKHLEE